MNYRCLYLSLFLVYKKSKEKSWIDIENLKIFLPDSDTQKVIVDLVESAWYNVIRGKNNYENILQDVEQILLGNEGPAKLLKKSQKVTIFLDRKPKKKNVSITTREIKKHRILIYESPQGQKK